jgi:hypothetical protein
LYRSEPQKKRAKWRQGRYLPFFCGAGDSPEALTPQMASIVEGGLVATLYVTLTTPGTLLRIFPAIRSSVCQGSLVGVAFLASMLSQQRI